MKKCTKCGTMKELSEFYKSGYSKNGSQKYKGRCKKCVNEILEAKRRAEGVMPKISVNIIGEKKCPKCGETKKLSEYYTAGKKKDGSTKYNGKCKVCEREYQVERHREKASKKPKKLKKIINGMKRCIKCGELKSVEEFQKSGFYKGKQRYRADCKECVSKESGERYINNRGEMIERSRKWRKNNPEYGKKYREANRDKEAERDKRWREANKEHCKVRRKKWYEANKESKNAKNRAWNESHKDFLLSYRKIYNKKNKSKHQKWMREYQKKKKKEYIIRISRDLNLDISFIERNHFCYIMKSDLGYKIGRSSYVPGRKREVERGSGYVHNVVAILYNSYNNIKDVESLIQCEYDHLNIDIKEKFGLKFCGYKEYYDLTENQVDHIIKKYKFKKYTRY